MLFPILLRQIFRKTHRGMESVRFDPVFEMICPDICINAEYKILKTYYGNSDNSVKYQLPQIYRGKSCQFIINDIKWQSPQSHAWTMCCNQWLLLISFPWQSCYTLTPGQSLRQCKKFRHKNHQMSFSSVLNITLPKQLGPDREYCTLFFWASIKRKEIYGLAERMLSNFNLS